jgi:hypothetical protein
LQFVLHWVHSLLHWLSLHWGDVVPAWLAVIVAAVFGWLSWLSSKASKTAKGEAETARNEAEKQAERAERATTAAEDAAAAAGRAADAAERSASAHETQAQLAQDQAEEAQRFPWDIERRGEQDFRLINLTKTRKYNVAVTGEPARRPSGVFRPGGGGGNSFDVVDGRERVQLDLFVAMQTVDRAITVSWHPTPDYAGDPWTQRIGLP